MQALKQNVYIWIKWFKWFLLTQPYRENNLTDKTCIFTHRRTGNFLPGGAVNHLPKKLLQVAQIFTKQSNRNEGHVRNYCVIVAGKPVT